MERRFGHLLPNSIALWLVILQTAAYALDHFSVARGGASLIEKMVLVPAWFLDGEYWRLFTFIFVPPVGWNFLFVLIFLLAFYYFGSVVEQYLGSFKFAVYLLIGYSLTAAVGFLEPESLVPSHYVETSVFLAFAAIAPEAVIYIYFIIPAKARYLAWFTWALFGFVVVVGDWHQRLIIIAAVVNYLFFFGIKWMKGLKQQQRQQQFQKKVATSKLLHECKVCGLTSDMAPRTTFRYCSNCEGQCCYCPDHIKDHVCVVE